MANSKKAAYGDAAETLFVQGGETREAIAARFKLSDKTVREWAKAGRWEEKRAQLLERRSSTLDDLEFVVQSVARSARMDIEASVAVSDQRLYALQKLSETLGSLRRAEKLKGEVAQDKKQKDRPATGTEIADKVDELLGITRQKPAQG